MDPALQSRLNLWAPKEALIAFFRPNEICLPQGFFFFFLGVFLFFLKIHFNFIFWLCYAACRIFVPQRGIEPMPPAMETWVSTTDHSKRSCGAVFTNLFLDRAPDVSFTSLDKDYWEDWLFCIEKRGSVGFCTTLSLYFGLPRWLSGKKICLLTQETKEAWVPSLGREDPLEEEMSTHSGILAWRIPWTEEPGGP